MISIQKQRKIGRISKLLGEIGLVVFGAWIVSRVFWVAISPAAITHADGIKFPKFGEGTAQKAFGTSDTSLLIENNYFRPIGSQPQLGDIPETRLNLKLKGVRAGGANVQAVAIIRTPDNKDKSYAEGDEIVSGVVLNSVQNDRVILDKNGSQEVLVMEGASTILTRAVERPAEPERALEATTPDAAAGDVIGLPSSIIGAVVLDASNPENGIIVTARKPDQNDLSDYGLISGDKIIAVDGESAADLGQQGFYKAFSSGQVFVLDLERDGQALSLRMKRVKEN